MHALAELHDTADSSLPSAPVGFGVVWIAQLVPFHHSANVTVLPVLVVEWPTAALAEPHDTPAALPAAPGD